VPLENILARKVQEASEAQKNQKTADDTLKQMKTSKQRPTFQVCDGSVQQIKLQAHPRHETSKNKGLKT